MEIGTLLGFVFTLLIFSYVLGDQWLYRIAVYVFVGLAAAYTTIITFGSMILPLLDESGQIITVMSALTLSGLLMLKSLKVFARFGVLTAIANIALGFLIAVGAAVAVVGAITGTLVPLSSGPTVADNVLESLLIFVGVATTLLYFQYLARRLPDGTVKRGRVMVVLSGIGQCFIAITLGAVYASAILSSLIILTERSSFLVDAARSLLGG